MPMADTQMSFSDMIAPFGVNEFFKKYWDNQHLHISRSDPDFFANILTLSDVDKYLQNQQIVPEFLRVFKEGEICPHELWTFVAHNSNNTFAQRLVDYAKLMGLVDQEKATIVAHSSEKAIPSLGVLTSVLEKELGCRFQTNLYLTPGNASGLPYHFDTHNVFVLQIYGSKEWELYDKPIENPVSASFIDQEEYREREPFERVTLRMGDLLFIPRGQVHRAESRNEASVHVSLSPLTLHWASLLRRMAEKAEDDPDFRRLVPHTMSSREEVEEFVIGFKERVGSLIDAVPSEDLLKVSINRKGQKRDGARLEDLMRIGELSDRSVLARKSDSKLSVKRSEGWFILNSNGNELALPDYLESAVTFIIDNDTFPISKLNEIGSEAGRRAFAGKLISSGICEIESV